MSNQNIEVFLDTYLRSIPHQPKKDGRIIIKNPGYRPESLVGAFLGVKQQELPAITVADPTLSLNRLFYTVMSTGNADVTIDSLIVEGFANCGTGFYGEFRNSWKRGKLLSPDIQYPPYLVVETAHEGTRWTRRPENGTEQLYHCIWHLRYLMTYLAANPIGKKTTVSASSVAEMLKNLPTRAAFVFFDEGETGVIYTDDTAPALQGQQLADRIAFIKAQTRKYTRPRAEIERELFGSSTSQDNQP